MSDDGNLAIVIIALLGNPFSPSYGRARARGVASALSFCSMNVALYATKGPSAWAFRERAVRESARTETDLTIGASTMRWDGDRLVVDLDERTVPFGTRLRGRVVIHPEARSGLELPIEERGEHLWWPVAPLARIEVDLPSPGVRFSGHGYHDANAGQVPVESSFVDWSWSRARTEEGGAAHLRSVVHQRRRAQRSRFASRPSGRVERLEGLVTAPLARTGWGLTRTTRVDPGHGGRVVRSLEDGPFYSRALVETRLGGRHGRRHAREARRPPLAARVGCARSRRFACARA